MTEEEKRAIKHFYNLRATIEESYMLFDEEINVKCGKETIKQISIILNLIEKQQTELEKKDNIIFKMAKAMNNFDIDEDICKQMGQKKYCSEYDEESECEKCIIEYFEKKEG